MPRLLFADLKLEDRDTKNIQHVIESSTEYVNDQRYLYLASSSQVVGPMELVFNVLLSGFVTGMR